MTLLRCSQKLLKRLYLPLAPVDPPQSDNPQGEWCADIDFIDRQPFALLMNAATGTVLVLPARAADLKRLPGMAAEQLRLLFAACGIASMLAEAELDAWRLPVAFARNGNRSLVASMNQRKYEVWSQFAHNHLTAFEVALRMLETPYLAQGSGARLPLRCRPAERAPAAVGEDHPVSPCAGPALSHPRGDAVTAARCAAKGGLRRRGLVHEGLVVAAGKAAFPHTCRHSFPGGSPLLQRGECGFLGNLRRAIFPKTDRLAGLEIFQWDFQRIQPWPG